MENFINENLVAIVIVGIFLVLLLLKKLFSKSKVEKNPIDRELQQQNKHAAMFGVQETAEPNDHYGKLSQLVSKAYTHKQKNVGADYITSLKNELTSILSTIGNYNSESIDDFINNLGCKVTSA